MPSLTQHQSARFTKLLLIGESGTGKTGSLVSLVKAGYKLRILDFDNGLDSLRVFAERDCPDKLGNVEYRTLRDKRIANEAGITVTPSSFVAASKMLNKWAYTQDGVTTDLGVPATWGEDTILVIDSLTFMSDAAFDWAEPLVPRSAKGDYDRRAVYGNAQGAIENILALLTGSDFRCNVIVTAHIRYTDMPDGSKRGHPTSVGQALGPVIPRYFNSVALCESVGAKRSIKTTTQGLIDLKNPAPFKFEKAPVLPLETGLATFFANVKGTSK